MSGSSYSICEPSLKFVSLPVSLIFGHGVYRPGDLDLWPFEFRPINGVTGHTRHALPSCQCGPHSPVTYTVCQKSRLSLFLQLRQMWTFRLRVIHGTDGQTNRQTTAIDALCPHRMWGHNRLFTVSSLWRHSTGQHPASKYSIVSFVRNEDENGRKIAEKPFRKRRIMRRKVDYYARRADIARATSVRAQNYAGE